MYFLFSIFDILFCIILFNIAKEEWEKIPAEKCKKLIDGYKKRLEAVITAKGCATKY